MDAFTKAIRRRLCTKAHPEDGAVAGHFVYNALMAECSGDLLEVAVQLERLLDDGVLRRMPTGGFALSDVLPR